MLLRYTLKRLLMIIPVSISISLVIFMIVHLLPGDPIDNLIQVGSSPEARAALVAKYGLDQPLIYQYIVWMADMFRGDFGTAIVQRPAPPGCRTDRHEHALQSCSWRAGVCFFIHCRHAAWHNFGYHKAPLA